MIIGVPDANSIAGVAYIIYGDVNLTSNIYLQNITVTQGFAIIGGAFQDAFGVAVSNAGEHF